MSDSSSFKLSGYLTVIIKPVDGSPSHVHYEGENLVVRNGKMLALDQLYYTNGVGAPLNKAKVGTGGSFDPEGLFLKTPSVTMVDLYTPVADVFMTRTARNTTKPSITLLGSVDASQCNGLFLNEAGFFNGADVMFNIKTFPGVFKTSSFNLELQWEILAV